jgi:hypothetical protein
MDEGRLTREQERSMLDLLEQAALRDYPNPERIGCPGAAFLERLAKNRTSINLNDPALTHVARCSPCYREFIGLRDAVRRRAISRRAALGVAGAVAAGIAFTLLKPPSSQKPGAYEQAEINLYNAGATRGTEIRPEARSPNFVLSRKRLDLLITLPFASQDGQYQVEVLHANGKPTGLTSSGTAYASEGKTLLRVRMDLSSLEPDRYQIGIRRVPFDWMPVPVRIK